MRIILCGIVCILVLGCKSGSQEVKDFCAIEYGQRLEAFKSYPISKRYELYLVVNDERSCDADRAQGRGYLHSYIVGDDDDLDFLGSKLEESQDEEIQRIIISGLYSHRAELRAKNHIVKIARSKADAMRGSFIERTLLGNFAVEETKEMVREMEELVSESAVN